MIHTKEHIQSRAEHIQGYIQAEFEEEMAAIESRGNNLCVYMAETGKLLADAKHHQDKARCESILQRLDSKLAPSVLNKLIDSSTFDENYLVNWMERINRSCTHELDWCRTMISKAKEEMRHLNFGT